MAIPKTPLDEWIRRQVGCPGGLTRTDVEEHQLHRLRRTVAWARGRSSFYREHLRHLPQEPIGTLMDLERLPFTTSGDVAEQGLRLLCVSQGDIARITTLPTSGTTGAPKRLFFTADDLEGTTDFFHHGMSTLVEPGQRVLILMPGERPGSVGDLLVKGLARMGVEGIVHGFVRDPEFSLREMEAHAADALVGLPVQVLALARQGERTGLPTRPPRSVLLSADYTSDAVVRAIEAAWGCRVFTHYGMTEMGLGGGVQCESFAGYHLREADLYVEIVDPDTGRSLPEGERGEVVFTTLTRTGMPLLRYRTGDLSRFLPEPCACGTSLRSLERVRGRVGGGADLKPFGHLQLPDLDEVLFSLHPVIDFSATLTDESGADRLRLVVQFLAGSDPSATSRVEAALLTIPALADAHAAGRLMLSVEGRPSSVVAAGTTEKRKLVDLRGR